MKILLSPAKLLQSAKLLDYPAISTPFFIKEAELLVKGMKRLSAQQIMEIMHVSREIAELNFNRYQNWMFTTYCTDQIQPCSFMFNGEVYKALDVNSLSDVELRRAQDQLFILSGLYGILKPLDLIYPYRLEMGTAWSPTESSKNLYVFWREKLTSYLINNVSDSEFIVDLASTEYSKVVDWKRINNQVVVPVFKEFKGGKYRTVMMYAKHARGSMARFIVKNEIKEINQLKNFNSEGYFFDEKLSSLKEWVFVR